jgi:membrane-associated phospholipid phosphatase
VTTRTRPLPAALTVVGAVVVAVLVVRTSLLDAGGQRRDQDAMEAVWAGDDTRDQLLSVLGYVSIGSAAAVLAGCVLVALGRRNVRLAIAAVVLVAGANLTTQLLKHVLLERPDHGLGVHNSLPSGHATVVLSVLVAALLVAPGTVRPLIGLGGGLLATFVATSMVVAGWHRPSDLLVAACVCLAWLGLVCLGLATRWRPAVATLALALVGSAVACAAVVAVGVRPTGGWGGATEAAAVLAGTGLAVSLTLALAAGFRPRAQP